MKWIALHIWLVFLPMVSKAQSWTVSGVLVAQETNAPLEGVIVQVRDAGQAIYSDAQGRYSLTLPAGIHLLEASILGRRTDSIRLTLRRDTTIDFTLTELALDLTALEITADKLTHGLTRLDALEGYGIYAARKNEVIVMGDFAANKAANTARQVFGKIPGLNIWESDFAGLQLDIAARGLGPGRTANFNTRQNGYDMSADALGYPESYYLPALQAVARIEIVRGAASLQYGSQFGGMLNFIIKEAPDQDIQVNLEQSIGSFGLLNSFVSVGGRKADTDYYAYYQYRSGAGWRSNSGFTAHTGFVRLGHQLQERLKIGIEYSYLNYQAQQPGGLTDERFNSGQLAESLRSRNWFAVSWNLLAATLDYQLSSRTKLNIRNFALFSGRDALGNLAQIGVPDNPSEARTLISDVFRNFGTELRWLHEYQLNAQTSALVAGLRYYNGLTRRKQGAASAGAAPDFTLLNPDAPEDFAYDFPSKNHAFFIENLVALSPDFQLTTGFRLEHIRTDAAGVWRLNRYNFAGDLIASTVNQDESSKRRWVPLWGLGGSYDCTEQLQIYTNYARNFRSITFSDLRVVNPNFQLDSLISDERGFNIDLGLRGQLTPWFNLDVSLFWLQYNDRIGQYELPGSTTLLRTNIGKSRHLGVELYSELDLFRLVDRQPGRSQLSWFTNLALTKATYIESAISAIRGRRVEYVPAVMLRSGLNYRRGGLKLSGQFSYLGTQFSDATNSTFHPNALTGEIPAYQVLDVSAEYSWNAFTLGAGVNNLTNEAYFTRRAVSYPGPGIIPATPRSFYFSLAYQFN